MAAYGFPCADAEMDAEPVGVCAGAAHAVYFRLRSLYAVLPGVDAVFDFAGGRVWLLPAHHRRNGHCRSRGMVQRLDCRIIKFLCRHCAAFSFCREVVELAATRLIALHKNKGKSVAACLKSRTDYAQNPDKTQQGELVSSYECSPLTVDEEFMLSKRQYELMTGRRQKNDVIAYQIRQSFKPGEITAEEANKVGYELAMRFTKGKYAFIVATHTDREHIHNHIIYNSTALDSTRKFRDFLLSGLAVQRLSDLICLEHQLSVIEIKPYRERQKRTLYPPRESNRDKLCAIIDNILLNEKPEDFEAFLQKLEQQGYEIKRGKHTSVKGTRQKRFIRFRTLGAGYSEDEIKAVIAGEAEHRPYQKQPPKEQPFHLLVDIQAKLSEGKSEGYCMQKIEVVVRITKDHCPPQEQTIFEWFDLMRNPTDALSRPDLEINLEHHRVFKHGTEVYMSRYEYGVLSLMAQHPGKLFTKEQIFEAVWHKDSESYLRAVTSTIGRIRQKIEDDKDHPRYIKTVSNIGYQFVPSSESVRLNRNL